MNIEKPKIREKTDQEYAREVRVLMNQGKDFHQASNIVLNNLCITEPSSRKIWKSRIGTICAKISGEVRKKEESIEEKSAPREPHDSFEQARQARLKNAKSKAPLFAGQIEEDETRQNL